MNSPPTNAYSPFYKVDLSSYHNDKQDGPTPRTDSEILKHIWTNGSLKTEDKIEYWQVIQVSVCKDNWPVREVRAVVPAEFARELEKEIQELQKRLADLEEKERGKDPCN